MKNISKWPDRIRVKINQLEKGIILAELPDYGVFTEADNSFELFSNINDLIYALFDIPKKFQGKIFYYPSPKAKPPRKIPSSVFFYSLLKESDPSRFHTHVNKP